MVINKSIIKYLKSHRTANRLAHSLIEMYGRIRSHYELKNFGQGKLLTSVTGGGNVIHIGKYTWMDKTKIKIRGNDCKIIIGDNCRIKGLCSLWLIGDNVSIIIGDNTTFEGNVLFRAVEDNTSIIIGNDCMFSNSIDLLTSDFHSIIDLETNERVNNAKSISIGSHVWIGQGVKILKGSIIGDNSIIGLNSVVSSNIPNNCIATGIPARAIKHNYSWNRKLIM